MQKNPFFSLHAPSCQNWYFAHCHVDVGQSLSQYRFSAFWLRSKCSICSYQLNIWYGGHVPPSILNWFLQGDRVQELAPALSRVDLVLQYRQDRPTSPLTKNKLFELQQYVNEWTSYNSQSCLTILEIFFDKKYLITNSKIFSLNCSMKWTFISPE